MTPSKHLKNPVFPFISWKVSRVHPFSCSPLLPTHISTSMIQHQQPDAAPHLNPDVVSGDNLCIMCISVHVAIFESEGVDDPLMRGKN
ncbi:hypothetical protein I3843_07G178200 [Carya illinoinensis]|nr:hypothetical protein I3843_07G178200 [Carya illinoinensis]